MRTESKGSRTAEGRRLERAIVLQLLRDDRDRTWSLAQVRTELEAERTGPGKAAVEQALTRLEGDGVLEVSEQAAYATNATRALDELGLICV